MSDLSMPHCEKCNEPEYACTCHEGECLSCGCKLDAEEIECGRDECFDCYCARQG